jgi:hypothetical protein
VSAVEVGRSRGVVLSFLYWLLRRLLELFVLRMRSEREKEIEILVLRLKGSKMRFAWKIAHFRAWIRVLKPSGSSG